MALPTCPLFDGLREPEVERVVAAARVVRISAGRPICRQGENGDSMFLIVAGRARVTVAGQSGEMPVNYLGPGDHFGELSLLAAGPRTATVVAVTDTELLELPRESFHLLTTEVPILAANLCRWMGGWMRREMSGKKRLTRPKVVALLRTSPRTAGIIRQVLHALPASAAPRQMLTDRPDAWTDERSARSLPADSSAAVAEVCDIAGLLGRDGGQLLLDLTDAGSPVLAECDEVWWLTEPDGAADVRMHQRLASTPELAARTDSVCLLPPGVPSRSVAGRLPGRSSLRVWASGAEGKLRAADLSRLVHRLQGIHAGLVLSGGAAWGLAHIGVLRALDRAGLHFDRVAGTSIGAIVGAKFAAGYAPADMVDSFPKELTVPSWLRWLPSSRRWFLLLLFRLGGHGRTLRRYFHDLTFADLLVPMHTMAVDLIAGHEVVRSEGSVVDALMESCNLPGYGAPILRDGQALMDGGILNNLPVDVMHRQGANFVVAVDVATGLSPHVGRNCATTPTTEMRPIGVGETLLRILQVQMAGMKVSRSAAADVLIAPDTMAFRFDDFSAAHALADQGERAAEPLIPEIERQLANLAAGA